MTHDGIHREWLTADQQRQFLEDHLHLVYRDLAFPEDGRSAYYEEAELISAGHEAIIRAARTFDPTYGGGMAAAYAWRCIANARADWARAEYGRQGNTANATRSEVCDLQGEAPAVTLSGMRRRWVTETCLCRRFRKRRRVNPGHQQTPETPSSPTIADPADHRHGPDDQAAARELLGLLTPRQRLVAELRDQGLTWDEVAERVGVCKRTAINILESARDLLARSAP